MRQRLRLRLRLRLRNNPVCCFPLTSTSTLTFIAFTLLFALTQPVLLKAQDAPVQEIPYSEEDTAAARAIADDFMRLNEHIGPNGLTIQISFIRQTWGRTEALSGIRALGGGLSGDILTGVPFLHLLPAFQYWSFTDDQSLGPITHSTWRDAGLSFNAVFITRRLSARRYRLFAGGGPSLHLTILSHYDDRDNVQTIPDFKNGIGALGGFELPLTPLVSFVATGTLKRSFEWDRLYRTFFSISAGLAI